MNEAAQVAKLIKAELKKNGIKATAKSSQFSMGNSVTVTIKQDILPATLNEIKKQTEMYKAGSFNGMEDIYEYNHDNREGPTTKYLTIEVEYSEEIKAEAKVLSDQCGFEGYQAEEEAWRIVRGSSPLSDQFWLSRKPRVKAA